MKSIFTLLLFSFATICFAQKDTTIIVNLPNKKYNNKHKKATGEENILKIAPLGFTSGTFPVYYERIINDFLTVQAGIGATSRNYIRTAIQQSVDDIKPNYPWGESALIDRADNALVMTNRKPALGYMLSVQPRLYFESDPPDGGYLGISCDFYRYNFAIPGLVNTNTDPTASPNYQYKGIKNKEHENISDFMVCFGYQDVYDRLSLDYSMGLGIRNVKGSKYYYAEDYINTPPGPGPINIIEGFAPYKQSLFNFNIGIKVGYHF